VCSFVVSVERTELVESSDAEQTISHSDEAEMRFKCSATADDSTPVNTTWYKLETDSSTGQTYEVLVYNRSEKLTITGPDNTLTIRLPANDSEGWAVYGGSYLCRATNGYSFDQRLIIINVVDIPATGTRHVTLRYVITLLIYRQRATIILLQYTLKRN